MIKGGLEYKKKILLLTQLLDPNVKSCIDPYVNSLIKTYVKSPMVYHIKFHIDFYVKFCQFLSNMIFFISYVFDKILFNLAKIC